MVSARFHLSPFTPPARIQVGISRSCLAFVLRQGGHALQLAHNASGSATDRRLIQLRVGLVGCGSARFQNAAGLVELRLDRTEYIPNLTGAFWIANVRKPICRLLSSAAIVGGPAILTL